MPDSEEQSPSEDYFNDMSRGLPRQQSDEQPDEERRGSQDDTGQIPRTKRIACVLCRKRKLRCDGGKPSCGTCTRLQHDCSYDEIRRKSGPKRGYVKALEARLAQVETLLKTQDEPSQPATSKKISAQAAPSAQLAGTTTQEFQDMMLDMSAEDLLLHVKYQGHGYEPQRQTQYSQPALDTMGPNNISAPAEDSYSTWEMIGLGLDEPLPTQDVIDELNRIFFEKVHPSIPMIHRPRYYAAMNLAPHMRPPVCLRYAMWANAAAVSDRYNALHEHFYHRARKYIQQDEMKGHGESMISVAHSQTWILLGTYEFKLMYFPRAWVSAGRAARMTLMMGLHRMDGAGLDVKQCLPPPKDWTEREERKRTFWANFCIDRYSSIGTGWPMMIEEKDITSTLPAEEEAYELGRATKTMMLSELLEPGVVMEFSAYSGVVLMACLFGRNLIHLHRPGPDDQEENLNGEFWKRHRNMDNLLLNIALALPNALRLPSGLNNPNVVFLNMNVHTSTICLHQAAIFKADKNRMPARISAESKVRCITAAQETASIMRQICHQDLSGVNPFISFCLYVAARVFVQYLKSRPNDAQIRAHLQFLLSAMQAIKRKNPLTESFLVQIDVDLVGAGLDNLQDLRAALPKSAEPNRAPGCPNEHLGMSEMRRPAYGDNGVAEFNEPNRAGGTPLVPPANEHQHGSFGKSGSDMAEYMYAANAPFDLPDRQRTSHPFQSTSYRSPQSNHPEMDMSPDASGDNRTPTSSVSHSLHNESSRTSNSAYSPLDQQQMADLQQQQQAQMHMQQPHDRPQDTSDLAGIFGAQFPTDFDMNSFQSSTGEHQGGFVIPQGWNGGSTGFTPGPTGMTRGSTGMTPGASGVSDMMGMSDADWNQVMDGFQGNWEAAVEHGDGLLAGGKFQAR